ncbi:hypothetical protein ACOME3_004583 [Neoechinorhynchus agilis]
MSYLKLLKPSLLVLGSGATGVILGSLYKTPAKAKEVHQRVSTVNDQPSEGALKYATRRSPYARRNDCYPGHVDFVIVGGGSAASSAAKVLRALCIGNDVQKRILIISEEPRLPYNRIYLSKKSFWTSDESSPPEHFSDDGKSNLNQLQNSDQNETLTVLTNHRVTELNSKMSYVTAKNLKTDQVVKICFSKCLLALGCKSREIKHFSNNPRVFPAIQSFQDYVNIKTRIDTSTGNLVVVGDDFAAVETASAFKQSSLYLICPKVGLLSTILPPVLSKQLVQAMAKSGVIVLNEAEVQSIEPTKEGDPVVLRYKIFSSNRNRHLRADYVLIDSGIVPSTIDLNESAVETDENGRILTNAFLQCSPDVYAAGSSISYFDVDSRKRRINFQYDHALMTGRTSAFNMFNDEIGGDIKPYRSDPVFWCDVTDDLSIEGIGNVDCRKYKTLGLFTEPQSRKDEGFQKRGVIIYLNDQNQIAGILLWNFIGKLGQVKDFLRLKVKDDGQNLLAQILKSAQTEKEDKKEENSALEALIK